MAWQPPEDELDSNVLQQSKPPEDESVKNIPNQWSPPKAELVENTPDQWSPPEDELDNSPTKIKDAGTLQQMKQSGQELTREQERILFDAEDKKEFTQKASEAVTTFVPTAIDIAKQLGTGAGEFLYKGVLKPIDSMSQSPEEAEKTLKEAKNIWRSGVSGVAGDIQETSDALVRFSMFGSSITDKLLGKSNDERFEKYMLREGMRQFAQKVYADDPDNAARLLAENPLLQKFASAAALAQGATPEEAELAKKAYEELVKEQGLTKDEINENVSMLGEILSPISLPGTNRITNTFAKATGKVTRKAGELALRGVVSPLAKGVAKTAGGLESGIEKIQSASRKIGEYAVGDPDTFLKTATNTIVGPAKLPAKMTKGIATTIGDVAGQAGLGRRGMFELAGRASTSGELTKKLFGPQALGGKGRARVADWAVRQSNAIIQPAVNGAVLNVALGLPDIETARDLGYSAGVGAGIGAYGGARLVERGGALIDPTTGLAEKIDAIVTPDPSQLRKDEDADIQRFIKTADPTLMSSIDELSNVNNIKSALDLKIKNLEAKKVAQINKDDERRIQDQIDNFVEQRKALDKSTPQTEAEIKRQVQLSFTDAMDLAKTTGAAAGLNNIQVKVLRPDQMGDFYRNLYGKTLTDAESVVQQLVGNPRLSPSEKEMLGLADQTIKQYLQDVAGSSTARGFAISEQTGKPNHLKMQNQTGATVVINGDLVTQMGRDGLNLGRVINHEMQHALSNFQEVRDMIAPIRKELFDQKVINADGTFEVVKKGVIPDSELDKFALQYAAAMDASGGASFLSNFANQDQLRNYMKEEYLSELAGLSGGIQGNLRGNLDSVGRSVVDWIESRTKNGALKRVKEALRNYGVIVDDQGQFSSVIGGELNPEALAMMRRYQRGLRDLNESLVYNSDPIKDEAEIPLTVFSTNRALQQRYKDSEFFEQQQVVKMTTPDGQTQEIVIPPNVKVDSFISDYRFANGQLVDELGNVISLGPDIPLQAMPDGTSLSVDTRIARNADGSPRIISPRESKRRAKKRGEAIRKAIDEAPEDASGVRLEDTGNGNYRGTLSPTQVAAINALPNDLVAPSLKRKIAFFNEILGRKDGTIVDIEYQAAIRDKKYRALQPQMRTEIPFGFQFDKQGNFLMTTMSMSRMHDKANAWAAKRPRNLRLWGGDMTKFWDSVRQYLYNHKQGLQGHIGLNPDPEIAMEMKNRINDLFNVYRKETRDANPERTTLPKRKGQDSRDVVIRSRRMDRINSYDETALAKMPFSYELAVKNYLPAENPLAELQSPEQFAQAMEIDTELARLAAQGNVEPLELQLHQQDLLHPAEYIDAENGKLRVRSMFDPTQAILEPMESEPEVSVSATQFMPAEMERAKFLSAELEKMYEEGGTDKRIANYESELEGIYQKLESDQESAATEGEENITEYEMNPQDVVFEAINNYKTGKVDNQEQTLAEHIRKVFNSEGIFNISPSVTDAELESAANDIYNQKSAQRQKIAGLQFMPAVQTIPERFTGTGKKGEERRGRYVAPPEFWTRFDIGEFNEGGKFFDLETGEDITNKNYATGTIDASGKRPSLVSDSLIDEMPDEQGRTWKTNLFRKSAGWDWISENPPEVAAIGSKEKPNPVLISVENNPDHFYSLKVDFPNGVKLARYPEGGEPRLRPTKKGQIKFGNEVGRIKTSRGKEHIVYDSITIGQPQFMPADSEYLNLAKDPEKNREKLQGMVDEAAKKAGFTQRVFHGSPKKFQGSQFKKSTFHDGFFFTNDLELARYYAEGEFNEGNAENVREFYIPEVNHRIAFADQTDNESLAIKAKDYLRRNNDAVVELADIKDTYAGEFYQPSTSVFAVFEPSKIKSADPVTYDDQGNVIPLSKRFQTTSPDIRFMPSEELPTKYEPISARIRPLDGISAPTKMVGAKGLALGEIEPPVRGKAMLPDMELTPDTSEKSIQSSDITGLQFMPAEREEKTKKNKDSLKLKMTKKALTDAALSQESWRDWYKEHQEVLEDFFGDYAELFQEILAVTSQASSVKANVGLALKAFGQLMRGEEFDARLRGQKKGGYLDAVIGNLNAIKNKTDVSGRKISNYKAANEGDVTRVVVDRHIARLLFGVDTPSKSQYDLAEKLLTEIANEIGWEPSQVQAALWAHSIVMSGKKPESYGAYLTKLESTKLKKRELASGLTGNQLTKRIGNLTDSGAGSIESRKGRGRYSPVSEVEINGVKQVRFPSGVNFMPSEKIPTAKEVLKKPLENLPLRDASTWTEIKEAPIITLKDLIGKKVFPAFADITSAGRVFKGIDSSELLIPIETHGGPEWPLIQPEKIGEEINVWSNQGAGVSATKVKRAEEGAIMLVTLMDRNAHKSNTEVANAIIGTNSAYARDKRIPKKNISLLNEKIKLEDAFSDFVGIDSPDINEYVAKLPFQGDKSRARLATILSSKDAAKLGAANVQRILDEMRSPAFEGGRIGDSVIALQLSKGAPVVKLSESGAMTHPSYQYAVRGRVIGKFARPINAEMIYDDFLAQRRAAKKPIIGDRRAIDLAKPVQVITKEIANRIPQTPYKYLKSPQHAEVLKYALENNWKDSSAATNKGGISPADFIDALNASESKVSLNPYTLNSVNKEIKTGKLKLYQLGDSKVFFGIKNGDPASDYKLNPKDYGFEENEKTLTVVLNGERGTAGMGDAIIMKALSEGVTALDAFAIKNKRYPDGMLPSLYKRFGFETVGEVPFDPKHYTPEKLADIKMFWKNNGWEESTGLPSVVMMKWKGNENDRTRSLRDIAGENPTSFRERTERPIRDARSNSGRTDIGQGGSAQGGLQQGESGRVGGSAGDAIQGIQLGRGTINAIQELLGMNDAELKNLGINPSQIQTIKDAIGYTAEEKKE